MRYLLTGDEFNAAEALRIGLVQEVVEPGQQLTRATELAQVVSAQAPLGVRATLKSARVAMSEGEEAFTDDTRRSSGNCCLSIDPPPRPFG